MEVVASLSQGRTAAAQCGLFTQKSVPLIFEPLCIWNCPHYFHVLILRLLAVLPMIFTKTIVFCGTSLKNNEFWIRDTYPVLKRPVA